MPSDAERRLAVLFHESEMLGAGVSVLRAVGELHALGWRSSGWFPGSGPLLGQSEGVLEPGYADKPIAFSARGWKAHPGVVRRLGRTPGYLRSFQRWLVAAGPDVVHANSLLMLPEATIARRRGFPVVVQVHELPAAGRKRDISIRWAAAVADVLVGVSGPVTSMLREHAGRTPVLTVHNGVPVVDSPPPTPDDFVVGTIGHISRTKGTDVFLRAAGLALRADPDLRFEHLGPARLWGDDEFDGLVAALGASPSLRGAVRMLGPGPASEALPRWSIFVLASRQEAFPLSTLEAMAAGIPVIATAVGGVPEQIVHDESGVLVSPEDPAALADWIARLREDANLRSRLALGGRERVREAFPLRRQADGLDRAYALAVERRVAAKRSRRLT